MLKRFLFLVCVVVTLSLAAKLPTKFKICKRTDPELSACLKQAVKEALPLLANGLPEFGVIPLRPLVIPKVTIGEGSTGAVSVVQNYRNFTAHTFNHVQVENVSTTLTPESKDFDLVIQIASPEYYFEADYDFNGRVMLLPIVGQGKCYVKLIDVKASFHLHLELFEKRGKTYMRAKECKLDLDPGMVTYQFDNLFSGNERLGKELNNLLNENWKEVYEDVRDSYERLLATVFQSLANNIFSKVPYDEIFPE